VDVKRVNNIFKVATSPNASTAGSSVNVDHLPKESLGSTLSATKAEIDDWRMKGLKLIAGGNV
jgi:hypothetical protein